MSRSTPWFAAEAGGTARRGAGLRRALHAALLAAACAAGEPASAAADTPGAVPGHVQRHVAAARLAGSGPLTWWGFHVYDARLYVPAQFDAGRAFAQPFALVITYARAVGGATIADSSRDEIARLGLGSAAERERWHAAMVRLFPDVAAGRTLTGVHLPERGVRFYADGRELGAIEDPAFARAFFAIWLDPRTRVPRLRDALLGAVAAADSRG